MRKTVLLLGVTALLAVSCGNTRARTGDDQKAALPSVEASAVAEEVPAAAEAAAVSGGVDDSGLQGTPEGELLAEARAVVSTGGEAATEPGKAQGGTKLLTKDEFLKSVWNYEKSPKEWVFLGDKPAIIDFYADWCGPCKIASPILEEVSHEFAGKVDVYKIDTQKEQELAAVFGVRSIPAFLYIPRNGKPTMMAGIARTKEDTKKMFIDNINTILLKAQ